MLNSICKGATSLFLLFVATWFLASCAAPTYLPGPVKTYSSIENTMTFGVQNMDGNAEINSGDMTCHYDGFDVTYKLSDKLLVSMVIINNSNKSLIVDKSKSYVLYDGYATQLFKDVRSSRSTTFNNVQDAINNVQTNEAGLSMTVPPYSKWELPLQETNVREIKKLPQFSTETGTHAITPYDNQETVEFVFPYSYDYSLADWKTCRNRIYVNSITVKEGPISYKPIFKDEARWLSSDHRQYKITHFSPTPSFDINEANRVDAINWKRYKKHKRAVTASHIVWSVICLPFAPLMWLTGCMHAAPPQYGNMPR